MSLNPFTEEQVAALRELSDLWGSERIVLIGASALGCHIDMKWRKTNDLDLSLSVPIDEYPAGLDEVPRWTRHPRKEHEWTSPEGVRVDIVPSGAELLNAGEVVWPESGFRMSLVGFRLASEHAVPLPVDGGFRIRVAPVPVVSVLKMVAYLDRPSERERDLQDLAHVLDGYLAEDEERRYAPEIIERGLAFEETNAFLLGADIAAIVNTDERKAVFAFLDRVRDEDDSTAARMVRLGPVAWHEHPQSLMVQVRAFERGFGDSSNSSSPTC